MNAKDLLKALNDIDPNLLKGAEPWGEPAQKVHRPVWAAAAAIVLCVGIVAGGVILSQQNALPVDSGSSQGEFLPKLRYSSGTGEKLDPNAFDLNYLLEMPVRQLTQEELDSLWNGGSLNAVAEDARVEGYATTNEEGNLLQVQVEAYTSQGDSHGAPAFTITLTPGQIPPGEEAYRLSFLNQPNNTVEGMDVYAARFDEYRGVGDEEADSVIYDIAFLLDGEQPVGVTMQAYVDTWGFSTEEEAQTCASALVFLCLRDGVNLDGIGTQEGSLPELVYAEDPKIALVMDPQDSTSSLLTQEEIAALWGLSSSVKDWASLEEEFVLYGDKVTNADGSLWDVTVSGSPPGSSTYYWTVQLAPGRLPQSCDVEDPTVVEGNNEVLGVPVYAAAYGSSTDDQTYVAMLISNGVGVRISTTTIIGGQTAQQAEKLLRFLVVLSIQNELSLNGPEDSGGEDVELSFEGANIEDAYEKFGDYLNEFFYEDGSVQDGEAKELSLADVEDLWVSPLPWDESGVVLDAYASISPEGDILMVEISGYTDNGDSATPVYYGTPLFAVQLIPQQDSPAWEDMANCCAFYANNEVNGVEIAAGKQSQEATGTQQAATLYCALLAAAENSPIVANVMAVSGDGFLTEEEAQAFVNEAAEKLLYGKVHFETLQEKFGTLELEFTLRPDTDTTFSNVWDSFSRLYLEHSSGDSNGVQRIDDNISEEELRSIWGGELPWEGMLTEDDTVTAVAHYSEEGELILFCVYGHRDNPEIGGPEAYQLFSIDLYNKELAGQWGQAANNALALADTAIDGVDIATEQTDSTMNYEDGTSMDFTCYSALFQPEQGPTLISVKGFANPLGFTQEEAQTTVNRTVAAILEKGIDLSQITLN